MSVLSLERSAGWVQPVKWLASAAQIGGYVATALAIEPLNLVLFLFGIVGWLAVALAWRDRAIVLIHIVALAAMLIGLTAR